jgi:SpoVK/Ycf46/Vps4 family AAA+-type ATPase
LFEQARRNQPSIIFFDEIDGLAPVRSVKQDQIHASIVSTLLALMDGLDSRGQVVVIGATNRPDAIDPALRRPGRFDRELAFTLPDAAARAAIIDINTGALTHSTVCIEVSSMRVVLCSYLGPSALSHNERLDSEQHCRLLWCRHEGSVR